MKIKIIFVSEALSAPFDEGIKNMTFSLHKQLQQKVNAMSVTLSGNVIDDIAVKKVEMNKSFLSVALRKIIRVYSPDIILYLPEASTTFASFLRAKVLKLMNIESKIVVLSTQHRDYNFVQEVVLKNILRPDLVLVLGKSDERFLSKKRIRVSALPPAVDKDKFHQISEQEKEQIRLKYGIPVDKTIVLHVGHIKVDRNIECLIEIQKIENMQVIIVGSTSIVIEQSIKGKLIDEGVQIIDEVVDDISTIYKMSDLYVFPVLSNREAIDMPLSVLEAMSCNLPVITTRFGALVDYFEEDNGLKYFTNNDELVEIVKSMQFDNVNNSKKIEQFTWSKFADTVISACENII